jgi:hypothetical protein
MSETSTIGAWRDQKKNYSRGGLRFAVFCSALDMIESSATPVHEWLAAAEDARDLVHRYHEFMAAVKEDLRLTDDTLRCQPYVTYDTYNDGICFIFKHDNNGNTVLVGYGAPPIREDEIIHGYVDGRPVNR